MLAGLCVLAAGCTSADADPTPSSAPGSSGDLESVLGRDAQMCTASPRSDAVVADIVKTVGDARVRITGVSLRSADNLEVVEMRAAPASAGGETRSPIGTDTWPLSKDGRWWWSTAAKANEPLSGEVLVMVHLRRKDISRDGYAQAMQISYTNDGQARELDNSYAVRISTACPTGPTS